MTSLLYTSNYELFVINEFNRSVSKVNELVKSMKVHGYIPAYPMHVTREPGGTGRLIIKAGHHRFQAASMLKIPVCYVICEDNSTIFELENSTARWTVSDYVTAFSSCGNVHYQTVMNYVEKTGIPISTCLSILGGGTARSSGSHAKALKQGTYEVTEDGIKKAETVFTVIKATHAYNSRVAVHYLYATAITRMLFLKEFIVEVYLKKMSTFPGLLLPQADLKSYSRMIEDIYNKASREQIPLVILADNSAKDRKPVGCK